MQTVAQLIEALRAFPPDLRVVVDVYEGGYGDVTLPLLVIPVAIGKSASYCGTHDNPARGESFPVEQCLLVSSGN